MLEILSLIHCDGDPDWVRSVLNWERAPWVNNQIGLKAALKYPHTPANLLPPPRAALPQIPAALQGQDHLHPALPQGHPGLSLPLLQAAARSQGSGLTGFLSRGFPKREWDLRRLEEPSLGGAEPTIRHRLPGADAGSGHDLPRD